MLLSYGNTHIGQKRKTNQDSIYVGPKERLFVVADGMGGHKGGDIASQIAVEKIPEYFNQNKEHTPKDLCSDSIQYANASIKEFAAGNEKLKGMGTTVNSLYFKGPDLYIGNVGDSRAYLVNNKKLYQLSMDHSLVQEKINMGIYTRVQAQADPQKNILIRTVGFEDQIIVDVFNYKVCKYDIFFNCSDGLHGKVSDEDIIHIINQHIKDTKTATQEDLKNAVEALIQQANDNGGQDNISVIMVLAR